MEGPIGTIFAICAILLTLAVVGGVIVLIRILSQVNQTASRVDAALIRIEPTVNEVELAVREWREIGQRLSSTAESAENLARSVEGMGSKAANAGRIVLSGIGGPVGRTIALMNAFRIGADVFFRLTGKSQKGNAKRDDGPARQIESGNKETESSKEVGSE